MIQHPRMRFLKRHRYLLGFMVVLVLCSLLVQWQYLQNESAHVRMREDFILLVERGHTKPAERFYQLLVQSFPNLSDNSLLEDLQRTATLINTNTPQENLIKKYNTSVGNESHRRAEKRVARLLEQFKE